MRLFTGGFAKFHLVLEKLPDWDVWQATIISEAYSPGTEPDEVFLLENVEQILYGPDNRMQQTRPTNSESRPTN